jgi:hypothetical protein
MHQLRVFSFEQFLEQLKHPWSCENSFSVFAKSVAVDEALGKVREKWNSIALICQRQLMMMLASESEADSSLTNHLETLASHVLVSENADDWLRYIATSSRGISTIMLSIQYHSLFSHLVTSPPRTPLPDESVVCFPSGQSSDPVQAVTRAAPVSKTHHLVPKAISSAAPVVLTAPALTTSEIYKPKNIAELVDCDEEEFDAKKGPRKKKRCR